MRRPSGSALAALLALALSATAVLAQPKPATPNCPVRPPATTANPPQDPDLAYGAFQRGYYLTAFREATRDIEQTSNPKAMTLLGELYADGLGIPNDDQKAAEWYKLAAARGDREAIFALAMFRMAGRAGPVNREEAAKLMEQAANLGHNVAAYDLALLYMGGEAVAQNFRRAAELLRMSADAGNPQAQYALATMYKEGTGVSQDLNEAARLLAAAARAGYTDAEIEYGIALFNGTGVTKDERAAGEYFLRASRKGSPVAQRRLALMYATGRGIKADAVQAARWHLIARAGGDNDQFLDDFLRNMNPADRALAEDKAKPWIARMQPAGPTPFGETAPVAKP